MVRLNHQENGEPLHLRGEVVCLRVLGGEHFVHQLGQQAAFSPRLLLLLLR